MITKAELEYYERTPDALCQLAEEVRKLREAVEKRTGRPVPTEENTPVKPEHPKDSQFDVLAVTKVAVTKVEVFLFSGGATLGHMKGMAKIVLNDQLVINGLRIMEGENGMFVGYPPDPFYKGEDYRFVCFPITRQLREHIENCVLEKYMELTK